MLAKRCAEFKKGRPRVKPGVTVIYRHFSLSYIIQIGSKSFRFIPADSGDGAMAREVERGSRGKSGEVLGDGGDRNRPSANPSRRWEGSFGEIGRAHVCALVTPAHLECRHLL